jgi:ABC-type uncharacterized transport system permease subunit
MGRALADWAPVLPFVACAGVLLLGSGIWLVRSSFEGVDTAWSLQAWRDIWKPGLNRSAIVESVELSLVVATLSAALGIVLAWYVANLARRGRAIAQAVATVAANFGGASLAIAMVSTFGSVGFVRLLFQDWAGWDLPLDLYGFWGLVVVYAYFNVPLYVLLVLPAMAALRPEWWEAVQTSAGTRWQYWRYVGGPVLLPFALAGWVLIFAWALGQFSVPFALLGEATDQPLMTLRLGDFLFSATGGTNRFQRAAALAVLLIAFSAVALVVYRAIAARTLRRLEGI